MSDSQSAPDSGSTTPTSIPPCAPAAGKAVSVATRTPSNNCFRGIFTIQVGPEKREFLIHKDLLSYYSDYFRGAFRSGLKEAVEGIMTLPDEDAEIFDIFNVFVYTRVLRTEAGLFGADLSFSLLIRTWIFGDRFIIPALQNVVMDAYKERSYKRNVVPLNHLHTIYENTMHGSPLRGFMVDAAAYRFDMSKMSRERIIETWPCDALVDLALTLSSKTAEDMSKKGLPVNKRHKCYYHVHDEGESC